MSFQTASNVHSTHQGTSPPRIRRINECCEILGIGRSTYYKLAAEGVIEPSIKISKRARGHTDEYLQALIQQLGSAK
jgi:predicted DNA-binding transcriptional regulator AlpA